MRSSPLTIGRAFGLLMTGCWVAIAVAALRVLYQLGGTAFVFLNGSHSVDAIPYWAVGRALLNGLVPYVDLFEPKPPAIFLLSAASFRLFDSAALGFVLNAIVLLMIPLLFIVASDRFAKHSATRVRAMQAACAFLFGSLLSLYAANQTHGWETEWFGAFFGLLYVVTIAEEGAWSRWRIILATVGLIGAVAFKEPFFLSCLAAALLLLPTLHRFLFGFLVPLALAMAAGISTLMMAGWAGGYFGIYLPAMLGERIWQFTPLWLRGFLWNVLVHNLATFSPLLPLCLVGLLACPAFLPSVRAQSGSEKASGIALVLMVLYLTGTAVGLGGDFQQHHFVLALPFYGAIFLHTLRITSRDGAGPLALGLLTFLVAIASLSTPLNIFGLPYEPVAMKVRTYEAAVQQFANAIDATLDRCHVTRYLFFESGDQYYGYTRHSPSNFFPFITFETVLRYPQLLGRYLGGLENIQLAVVDFPGYEPTSPVPAERRLGEAMQKFLSKQFSTSAWPCARGLPSPSGRVVLFSNNPEGATFPFHLGQ